jgi:DNA helicase-2/ATP-dependent DNA helicase PcrA
LRFFEQAHIKDLTSYLKIVTNPRDEMAWKRVMKLYPKIGRTTADTVWSAIEAEQEPLAAARSEAVLKMLQKGARKGWGDFMTLLNALSDPGLRKAPSEMIRLVLERGYKDYLVSSYANFSARLEDIERLSDFSVRYADVADLLSELVLTSGVSGQDSLEEPEPADTVVLSTVHQAKGLEWRVVFVIWLVDGKIPDGRALREEGGEEEERRLFYVAVTRARDQLYLVHPVVADERGLAGVIQRPSRFLQELDRDLYEKAVIGYDTEDPSSGGPEGDAFASQTED